MLGAAEQPEGVIRRFGLDECGPGSHPLQDGRTAEGQPKRLFMAAARAGIHDAACSSG